MKDTISRSKLLADLGAELRRCPSSYANGLMVAKRRVVAAPDLDAEERESGMWCTDDDTPPYRMKCSKCGYVRAIVTHVEWLPPFCESCGIRLIGSRKENKDND